MDDQITTAARQAARTALEQEAEAKNRGFKQIYPRGWQTLRTLSQEQSTLPLRLWTWFAENSGPDSTICVRQKDIAVEMGVSVRQVQRAIDVLEEKAGLVAFKEFGLSIYALDPRQVWASWSQATRWAPFHTKTLLPKGAKEGEAFGRRVAILMQKAASSTDPIAVPSVFRSLDEVAEAYDADEPGRREQIQQDTDADRAESRKQVSIDNKQADMWDAQQKKRRRAVKKAA
jgi:DNA-binding MarR family transcriptional regulator